MPTSPDLVIDRRPAGVSFWIHVSPRSRKDEVGGLHGGALRLRVRAAPVQGAANAACVRILAAALEIPASRVALAANAKGRRKRVSIEGEPGSLASQLLSLAGSARVG